MNAAFLLVATSWLAGADPAPAAGHVAPVASGAPVASSSCCGGGCNACCDTCNTCCDSCCHESCFSRWAGKLRGLCHRDCCDSCCDSCSTCNTCYSSCNSCNTCNTCNDCCDSGCGHRWFHRCKSHDCCDSCSGSCNACTSCNDCCDSCCHESCFSRLRNKFRGWCHHDCCDSCCNSCGCDSGCGGGCGCNGGAGYVGGAVVAPNGQKAEPIKAPREPAKKMPSTTGGDGNPGAGLSIDPETKSPFELSRRRDASVEDATDYSRLTGRLFYVHADGGLWVLRYAPVSTEDANGGSVVFARDARMDGFHEGDLVSVRGEVAAPRASTKLGGPLYRVQSIELLEKAAD